MYFYSHQESLLSVTLLSLHHVFTQIKVRDVIKCLTRIYMSSLNLVLMICEIVLIAQMLLNKIPH